MPLLRNAEPYSRNGHWRKGRRPAIVGQEPTTTVEAIARALGKKPSEERTAPREKRP